MPVPDTGSPQETRPSSPGIEPGLVILLALGGLLTLILLIGIMHARPSLGDCQSGEPPLSTLQGNIRQAGEDDYLVADKQWHLLQSRCSSKIKQASLEATDHAEIWLEAHLGETVSAHRCPQGIVDYTVAERRFFR